MSSRDTFRVTIQTSYSTKALRYSSIISKKMQRSNFTGKHSKAGPLKRLRLRMRRIYETRKEGLVDILDESGNSTGKSANIYDIHEHGYWHRTANVYVVN